MKTVWGKTFADTLDELVDPVRTALLLIDIQKDYCDDGGHYDQIGRSRTQILDFLPRVGSLVDSARAVGVLPVWVQQTLLPGAAADSPAWLRRRTRGGQRPPEWTIEGSWGHEVTAALNPQPGEPRIWKFRSSSFRGTHLDLLLRSNGINALVIAGLVTQGCVESTVRDATFYDYYVTLLTDCVGTTDNKLHEASLLCQSTRCDFALAADVMAAWERAAVLTPAAG